MSDTSSTRRDFLKAASAGAVALSLNASTYARAAGANERISIGVIGCGRRGLGSHMTGVNKHAKDQNIEITAVCDPWRQKREAAAAKAKEWYGTEARQFVSYLDLLAADNIDAVMIASCDHQHTTHLEATAKAKKDVYCEKPLAMDLEKLKSSCDAVRESGVVFQAGTQLRSFPSFTGCRELFKTGALGNVARIEQRRNASQPYWYSRLDEVKEEDVDWKEFLMDRPMRPFDPDQYSGWYGYRDFSDGPVPGLGTHFLDLVHYITGAKYPTSAVSTGGVFTWKDEHHFTCPDNVQAEWIYPEGFLVSYSTNFGNGSGNSFKIFGNKGSMDLIDWDNPVFTDEGIVGMSKQNAVRKPIENVPMPDHYLNWLECLRNRKTPNADIEAAYQHGIASLLAVRAFDTGTRQIYDQEKREFRAG